MRDPGGLQAKSKEGCPSEALEWSLRLQVPSGDRSPGSHRLWNSAGRPSGRHPHPSRALQAHGGKKCRFSSLRPETLPAGRRLRKGTRAWPARRLRPAPGALGGLQDWGCRWRPLTQRRNPIPPGSPSPRRPEGGKEEREQESGGRRPAGRRGDEEGGRGPAGAPERKGESERKGGRAGERRGPARPGGKRNQRFFKGRRASSSKPAQRHFQETAGAAGSAPRTRAFPGRAAGSENWGWRVGGAGAVGGRWEAGRGQIGGRGQMGSDGSGVGGGERGQMGSRSRWGGQVGAQTGAGSGETARTAVTTN